MTVKVFCLELLLDIMHRNAYTWQSLNQIHSHCHQESGILQGITPKWTPPSTLSFDRCKLWNIWTWPLRKTFQRLLKALFKLHLNNLIRILRVDFIMWLQGDKPDPLLGSVEVRPSTSTLPPRLRPRSKNCPGDSTIPEEMWFWTWQTKKTFLKKAALMLNVQNKDKKHSKLLEIVVIAYKQSSFLMPLFCTSQALHLWSVPQVCPKAAPFHLHIWIPLQRDLSP